MNSVKCIVTASEIVGYNLVFNTKSVKSTIYLAKTYKGTKAWCKLHSKINFKIMYYIAILAQNLYVFLAIADVLN